MNIQRNYVPIFSASWIVSGKFAPKVSGSSKDISPDANENDPNTINGKELWKFFSNGMNGAKSDERRATVENVPTHPLRTVVGIISAANIFFLK